MANPAAAFRANAQARWNGASVAGRGRSHILHQHPTEPTRFMLDSTIGPIHYGAGNDQEIDTAWQPTGGGAFEWEMTTNDWQTFARTLFNAGDIFEFHKGPNWVRFDPQSINWIDENTSRQQIAIKQAVNGVVADDLITYTAAYGPGRHFSYHNRPGMLKKLITIDSAADLPTPTVQGNEIWFEAEFTIATDTGTAVYLDGVKWAKSNGVRVQTANRIEFRDEATGAVVFWHLDFPRAWDSEGNEVIGQMEVRRQGGPANLFITVRIPKTWIDQAVFPIYIDPTIDASVASGDYDGFEQRNETTFDSTSIFVSLFSSTTAGNELLGITIFTLAGIASGDTVDVAYIAVKFFNTTRDSIDADIYCEDIDDSPDLATNADVVNRALTTATVAWDGTDLGATDPVNSPSIVGPVQEVIDRAGWAAGNDVGVIVVGALTSNLPCRIDSYERGTTAPAIHIEYTAGGGGTEYTQSIAGTVTSGGIVVKQTAKGLAGVLTSGGVIAALRTAFASLAGTMTSSGTLIKQTNKGLAGTLTSSGTVAALRTAYTMLVGTLTSGGTLTKQTNKGLGGALTSSGALSSIRTFLLSLAGTLTSGGTLTKQTNKNLAGVLTSSGTLAAIRTFLLSLAGTLTSGGVLTKHTSKGLAGTLSSSGVVTTLRTAVASFAGTFTSSGLLSKQTNKELAGTFTSSGALGVISTFLLSLAGTLTSSGVLSKRTGKGLAGTLTSSGAVIKQAAKGLAGTMTSGGVLVKQTSKNLAGVFTSSGTLAAMRTFLLSLAGTLTSSGILSKQTNKGFAGVLTSGGTLGKQTAKGLAGILTSGGAIVKQTAKGLAGTLTSSGVLAAVLGGAATALISLTVKARDFTLSAKTRAFSLSAKIRDFTLTAKDRD